MEAHVSDLLPPNASAIERNLAATGAAIDDIPIPIRDIGDAKACPDSVLPFLGWARSVDRWEPTWPDATKRAVVDSSFFVHQHKGTVGAIRRAIEPMGYLIRVVPWYDMEPPGPRGTFALDIGVLDKGITEDTYEELELLIDGAKPLSRHLTGLAINVEVRGAVRLAGAPLLGDVLTVYPFAPDVITAAGSLRHAGAFHIIDTVTVAPLEP